LDGASSPLQITVRRLHVRLKKVESKVKRGESTDQQGATFVFKSQQSRDNDLTYTDPGSPLGIEIYFACRSPAFGKLSYCVVVFCV
jgi:hypothetical protein